MSMERICLVTEKAGNVPENLGVLLVLLSLNMAMTTDLIYFLLLEKGEQNDPMERQLHTYHIITKKVNYLKQ